MSEMQKIKIDALENVVGGKVIIIYNDNKEYGYANCRSGPGLDSAVLSKMPNGTQIFPTGNHVKKDDIDWYEVDLGGNKKGWIAYGMIGQIV